MISENKDSWVVFQIYDETTERWSPPYTAPSIPAMMLECKEMAEKYKSRPFMVRAIGLLRDSQFEAVTLEDTWFNREEEA
jgi:hypothetical protein